MMRGEVAVRRSPPDPECRGELAYGFAGRRQAAQLLLSLMAEFG
jgi:hypothetical protein